MSRILYGRQSQIPMKKSCVALLGKCRVKKNSGHCCCCCCNYARITILSSYARRMTIYLENIHFFVVAGRPDNCAVPVHQMRTFVIYHTFSSLCIMLTKYLFDIDYTII